MGIKKNFFTIGVVRHGDRLTREVVESPSLKEFRKCVGVSLGNMVVMEDLVVLG